MAREPGDGNLTTVLWHGGGGKLTALPSPNHTRASESASADGGGAVSAQILIVSPSKPTPHGCADPNTLMGKGVVVVVATGPGDGAVGDVAMSASGAIESAVMARASARPSGGTTSV